KTFDVALTEASEGRLHLCAGALVVKGFNVQVGDSWLYPDRVLNALPGDLVANEIEGERFVTTFPGNDDLNRCAPFPSQQIGHLGRGQVLGGFVVHRQDDVTGPYAGPISRRAGEWRNHDGPVVALDHAHTHAVVMTLLFFPDLLKIARIEEIRMRIQSAQHAGNSPPVYGPVRVERIREILFDGVVGPGEDFQT